MTRLVDLESGAVFSEPGEQVELEIAGATVFDGYWESTDDVMGERVGAVVVTKPGETVEFSELTEYLREQGLAIFKLPEALRIIDEIPHNVTGKVLRREIKHLFNDIAT